MGRSAVAISTVLGALDQGAHTQVVTLTRATYTDNSVDASTNCFARYGTSNPPTALFDAHCELAWGAGGNKNHTKAFTPAASTFAADTQYYWRAFARFYATVGCSGLITYRDGSVVGFMTNAVNPTIGTPSLSGETYNTVTVDGNWTPATSGTTVTVWVQYKRNVDPTWTTWGSSSGTGTGYNSRSITQTVITGLDSDTLYNFRLYVDRAGTTNSTVDYYGSTASATTSPGTPEVTTNAATNIAATTAILHGTLVINEGAGVNVYFKWDENTPPVANQTANQSKSADDSFQQAISGLSYNTLYYFQAFTSFSSPAGSPLSGSILSFTTAADPSAKIGSFWVEDVSVDWVDTNRFVKSSTGADLGLRTGKKKGSIWVEGDNLHYIDNDTHERRITGILGDVVAGLPGSIWVQPVVHQLRWVTEVSNKEASMGAF